MARQRSGQLGRLVLDLLFGKQVEEGDYEAQKTGTRRYQKRKNKLAFLSGLLAVGFMGWCVWEASDNSIRSGITVAFVILVLLNVYALSTAADAIFESLSERINLQSAWLHARLTEIESNTAKDGKLRAQARWERHEVTESTHYSACPELWRTPDPLHEGVP
jgi:hypothetical protein